jgi:predicted amidohydrolase YtcJ
MKARYVLPCTLVSALAISACGARGPSISPEEARAIAREAYVYASPMVDGYSIIHAYMADEPETSVIADMAEYGIIASINPGDVTVEGDSFLQNVGEDRMTRLLPFRTYLDGDVMMASGSDYSVAPWDPWIGIYAMRTRRLQVSGVVANADQTIPLQDALKTYTINGAYLNYDEDARGSLEVGKLADLVVIDAELLSVPDEELIDLGERVMLTMVGGQVAYQWEGAPLPGIQR